MDGKHSYYELLKNFGIGLNFFFRIVKSEITKNFSDIESFVRLLIDQNNSDCKVEQFLIKEKLNDAKERFFNQGFIDCYKNMYPRILSMFRRLSLMITYVDTLDGIKTDRYNTMRFQMKIDMLGQLQIAYVNGFLFAQDIYQSPKKPLSKIAGHDYAFSDFLEKKAKRSVNYFMPHNYNCNKYSSELRRRSQDNIEDSSKYQYSVYLKAKKLITNFQLKSVLDIGCGMGMKLKELIYPICQDVSGIDTQETITACKQIHDFGNWHACDLNDTTINIEKTFDLIIASDVIEHLNNPDNLLNIINTHSTCTTFIVLSTPERTLNWGIDHLGPSPNNSHVREWTFYELKDYIESKGFHIMEHFLVPALKNTSDLQPKIMAGEGSTQTMLISKPFNKDADPENNFFHDRYR